MAENYNLSGILAKDCEVRQTTNGNQVINFSIPVNKSYKDKKTDEWVNVTKWVNCVWWCNYENAAKRLVKDAFVSIVGEPIASAYIKDGQPIAKLECKVLSIQVLGIKAAKENTCPTHEGQSEGLSPEGVDDLPF